MQYSACDGLWKNCCCGDADLREDRVDDADTYGSSSHRKMIAVATVEVTTGAKTAVR